MRGGGGEGVCITRATRDLVRARAVLTSENQRWWGLYNHRTVPPVSADPAGRVLSFISILVLIVLRNKNYCSMF